MPHTVPNEPISGLRNAQMVQRRRAQRVRLLLWIGGVALGALIAWASRNQTTYDAVAYIDLARKAAEGNYRGLVNGFFSPGYPALLGFVLRLLRPSAYWLYGAAHLLNFLIFLAALAAFDFLWRELGRRRDETTFPEWVWNLLGYGIFLWAALNAVGVSTIKPDLLLCGFLLLVAGLLLRARRTRSAAAFAALGAALALGYLAKAPMFPIALLVLAIAPLRPPAPPRIPAARLVLACVVFAATASPWIFALHARYGRWTFGDSGAFNYAWHVNGARNYIHWQGGPPGNGVPVHTTPKIFDHPEAFNDAGPISGTFPPWDDPSYWNDGLRPHFDLRQQVRRLAISLRLYVKLVTRPLAVLAIGFLVLAAMSAHEGQIFTLFGAAWEIWLIGAAGLGMFALVLTDLRYVGGFLVLLPAGLFAGLRLRRTPRAAVLVPTLIGLSLLLLVVRGTIEDFRGRFPGANHPQWQVVQELGRDGLRPGDRVALLGQEIYWAPMSGMEITADIPEPQAPLFWQLDDGRRALLVRKLAGTGAQAIVAGPRALAGEAGASAQAKAGWQPLGNTGFQIYLLRR